MLSLHLLLLALVVMTCSEVKGRLMLYGEEVSNTNQQEFVDQICPKPNSNDRKYVRIKTYNDKYVYANAQHNTDLSYIRTRCCGAKDAVGRKDVKVPSRRTTFLVHCKRIGNQDTVMFEILNKRNNYPSGYYIYVNPYYRRYGLRVYKPQWDKGTRFNFVIKRWRGPVVGIRTYGARSDWLSFKDERNSDGLVKAYKNRVYYYSDFPSIDKTFTLEAVPSGCVDGAIYRDYVMAAPTGTGHEECESKPDRCYWTDGWRWSGNRDWLPGVCYYNKDSMCYWVRQSNHIPTNRLCTVGGATIRGPAAACEAANCCYDYKRRQCFKPL